MIERIAELREQAEAAIASASSSAELEELRVRYLGRKAELPNVLRGVGQLPPEQRGPTGKAANQARQALEALISARGEQLAGGELEAKLEADAVDVTLPGSPPQPVGGLHLLSSTRREIEDVFLGLGFKIVEGPEVETVYYNFDALNHAPTHPGPRAQRHVLRRRRRRPAHAHLADADPRDAGRAAAAVRHRARVASTAADSDATHTPQFHQIEGLAVDEDITLADLKGTLLAFARAIFGPDRDVRLRPHFFPFTEPSVEVDVSCFNCKQGFLRDGSRCPVCKGTQWLEILGSGMVDPNVFAHVAEHGYDPERVQGFAFGMGIERIAMLKHAVPDLRLFYDNDVRFLEQFA